MNILILKRRGLFIYVYLMLLYSSTQAQTYEFKYGETFNICDINGNIAQGTGTVIKGWTFYVANVLSNNDVVIRVNKFSNNPELNDLIFQNSEKKDIFLKIPSADFEKIKAPTVGDWTFGTVLLPIKLRFGDKTKSGQQLRHFDFTSEINLGLSIGRGFGKPYSKIKKHIIFSLAVTSIPVDATTTNGLITTKTNVAAFTPSIGYVMTFDSGIQLVTSCGIDYMSRELRKKWDYSNQPWLGIGIGFSLFKFGDKGN